MNPKLLLSSLLFGVALVTAAPAEDPASHVHSKPTPGREALAEIAIKPLAAGLAQDLASKQVESLRRTPPAHYLAPVGDEIVRNLLNGLERPSLVAEREPVAQTPESPEEETAAPLVKEAGEKS